MYFERSRPERHPSNQAIESWTQYDEAPLQWKIAWPRTVRRYVGAKASGAHKQYYHADRGGSQRGWHLLASSGQAEIRRAMNALAG